MSRPFVARGMLLGLVFAIAGWLAGCHDVPKPACGFRCGPAAACPADYTCGNDNRCRLDGSSPSLVCGTPDAGDIEPDPRPMVVDVAPAPNSRDVPLDTVVSARFSEDVTNVDESTFSLFLAPDGSPVSGTVSYEPATLTATFTPLELLPAQTEVTAFLASSIVDTMGFPLPGPVTFRFTTVDTVPPAVASTVPADTDTDVAVDANIVVTFDEPVQNVDAASFTVANGGAIAGTITASNGDTTYTFDPTADLPAGTAITATLSTAITDSSGNALAAPVTFSFTPWL